MTVDKRKFLTILKNLYSGDAVLVAAATRSQELWEAKEKVAFATFQIDVGALFLELKEELDQGLEELAPVHPEEPDPRKWDFSDWFQFEQTTQGHKFYEIYESMAKCEDNIHLVWDQIEARIEF